jgi:phospho-N-acetylmuramoyl-pentapeptide-transferase
MTLLTLNVIKVAFPAVLAFFIGISITPILTDFAYKNKLWKQRSRKIDSTENEKDKISETFKKIHNEEGELSTPRVGGLVIWLSASIAIVLIYVNFLLFPVDLAQKLNFLNKNQTILPFFALIFASLIGLLDDLLQVKGGINFTDGISRKWRIMMVLMIAVVGAWWFSFKLGNPAIHVPFVGDIDFGVFFVPFFIFVMLGVFSGSVIDGIDGLAAGVMACAFGAYMVVAFLNNQINLAAFCAVIAGGILSFLWFNIPPARFYMGETGMLGLTVTLSIVAFLANEPLLLPVIAFPLLITSLSSSAQMFSKKYFKKKILLVAPIHHHFEALGWPSYKVTMRYWIISIICAIIGIVLSIIS